jgi:hypothetical protein
MNASKLFIEFNDLIYFNGENFKMLPLVDKYLEFVLYKVL